MLDDEALLGRVRYFLAHGVKGAEEAREPLAMARLAEAMRRRYASPRRRSGGTSMPTLNVKEVPEDLMEALRRSAEAHERSVRGEVLFLLRASLREEVGSPADVLARIRELRRRYRPAPGGPSVGEILADDRSR